MNYETTKDPGAGWQWLPDGTVLQPDDEWHNGKTWVKTTTPGYPIGKNQPHVWRRRVVLSEKDSAANNKET